MKKEFIIQIKRVKDSLKDFAVVYKKIEKGEKMGPVEKLTFTDIDVFRKFLTNKRIELLRLIKNKKPTSIKEIEKLTKRDYKSICVDLNVLKKMDLISIEKENNKSVPKINYKEIDIKITLEA